jgi:hypothetical protein
MTTNATKTPRWFGELALAIFWVVLLAALLHKLPAPLPQRVFANPRATFAVVRGGTEIAHYEDGERLLDVTEHAPRDLLVCMRGTCHLVEEWLQR